MRMAWIAVTVIVLGLALALPSQLLAQQPSREVPVWKLGDFWTWRWEDNRDGGRSGEFTRTVTKANELFEGQKVYWISRGDGTFEVRVTDSLWMVAVVDASGTVKTRYIIRFEGSYFPLTVGKTIGLEFDSPADQFRGRYTHSVIGIEEVRTRAGTFPAYRVIERGQGETYRGSRWALEGEMYFAPGSKSMAKHTYTLSTGYKYSRELIRYQVRD
jgi:hypothetical protein